MDVRKPSEHRLGVTSEAESGVDDDGSVPRDRWCEKVDHPVQQDRYVLHLAHDRPMSNAMSPAMPTDSSDEGDTSGGAGG